jgi:hypothetical protein
MGGRRGTWAKVGIALVAAGLTLYFGRALVRMSRESVDGSPCAAHQHAILIAIRLYADDHDGHLPPAIAWNAYLTGGGYIMHEDTFHCPDAERLGSPGYDYAYNPALAGKSVSAFREPSRVIAIFDADRGQVAPRHGPGRAFFGFLDGIVQAARIRQTPQGWRVEGGPEAIRVPFGSQAVPPAEYRVARDGSVTYLGREAAHDRGRRRTRAAVIGGVVAVLVAGVLGWALGRRR